MSIRIVSFLTCAILLITATAAPAQEYSPKYDRIRAGLQRQAGASPIVLKSQPLRAPRPPAQRRPAKGGRSIWRGVLIGAGVGAVGGGVWGAAQCHSDSECTAIAVPAGVLGGACIGAAVGAIVSAIRR